jgi:hypothetical protein
VKWGIRDYLLYTIHKDWPAHSKGNTLNGGANRAEAIRGSLAKFEPTTNSEQIVQQEAMSVDCH